MNKEILIADDDPVVRHLLGSILSNAGYQVIKCESGASCIEVITERARLNTLPAAVFLDVLLNDMSGIEVFKKIREHAASLPVIMLSANPQDELRERFSGFNPDYFLEKPFTPNEVLSVLDELLG